MPLSAYAHSLDLDCVCFRLSFVLSSRSLIFTFHVASDTDRRDERHTRQPSASIRIRICGSTVSSERAV